MRKRRLQSAEAVRAWNFGEVLLESYRYGPGPAGQLAPHAHPVYQLGISLDTPGEYTYRRARYAVPARAVSVLHPDEPHAARDVAPRERPATFWVLYFSPRVAARIAGTRDAVFFAEPVITEPRVFSRVAALPGRLMRAASDLEREIHFEQTLRLLLARARLLRPERVIAASRRRLDQVRDRLEDEAGNPSLPELAAAAGLSPWRFCREFRRRFGEPPHAYLLHARIRRAKQLLLAGTAIAETALRCGFTDQSHFARHFRRLVDVTPARYRDGRINPGVTDPPTALSPS